MSTRGLESSRRRHRSLSQPRAAADRKPPVAWSVMLSEDRDGEFRDEARAVSCLRAALPTAAHTTSSRSRLRSVLHSGPPRCPHRTRRRTERRPFQRACAWPEEAPDARRRMPQRVGCARLALPPSRMRWTSPRRSASISDTGPPLFRGSTRVTDRRLERCRRDERASKDHRSEARL
jgi:hypothetical protein